MPVHACTVRKGWRRKIKGRKEGRDERRRNEEKKGRKKKGEGRDKEGEREGNKKNLKNKLLLSYIKAVQPVFQTSKTFQKF